MLCIGKPSLRCEQRARPKLNKPSRFALALRSGLRKGRTFLRISKILHEFFTYRSVRKVWSLRNNGWEGKRQHHRKSRTFMYLLLAVIECFSGSTLWCEILLDWAAFCGAPNTCAVWWEIGKQAVRKEKERERNLFLSLSFSVLWVCYTSNFILYIYYLSLYSSNSSTEALTMRS